MGIFLYMLRWLGGGHPELSRDLTKMVPPRFELELMEKFDGVETETHYCNKCCKVFWKQVVAMMLMIA